MVSPPMGCGVQETAPWASRAPLGFRLHPSLERLFVHSLLSLGQSGWGPGEERRATNVGKEGGCAHGGSRQPPSPSPAGLVVKPQGLLSTCPA